MIRRIPIAVAVVALVALVVLAMLTGTSAHHVSAQPASAPVTAQTVVCPALEGSPPGTRSVGFAADVAKALSPPSKSTGSVTVTLLARSKSHSVVIHPAPTTRIPSVAKTSRTVSITAKGSVAASLAADELVETPVGRYRALSGVRCAAPATDWWFSGADGRVGFTDALILANPVPSVAEATVTLWGDKGPLQSPRLESLRLPGRSVTRIPIASVAPDDASVAVHVHATSGSVTAAILDRRTSALKSLGGDFIPAAAPPGRQAVVAGYPPGSGPRFVIIANPGGVDATVGLKVTTKSGSFTPTGINQVVVRAGHTRAVEIAKALNVSSGAVSLSSDQPIVANGLSVTVDPGQRPDIMWQAAAPPITNAAAVAGGREPDGGHTFLYLAAPQGAARVKVSAPTGRSTTISVPAGHSVVVDITTTIRTAIGSWPFVVTPLGSAPVYGVRAMYFNGAHGALITGEPVTGLPTPIVLPPVRDDPTVALN
jgi:Family of unknown function (DUF5719)